MIFVHTIKPGEAKGRITKMTNLTLLEIYTSPHFPQRSEGERDTVVLQGQPKDLRALLEAGIKALDEIEDAQPAAPPPRPCPKCSGIVVAYPTPRCQECGWMPHTGQ
jgi:hypothetical protein